MSRRRLAAWSVALPLMVAGSQVAHVLAYRLAYPQMQVRLHALLVTGHGYMARLPLVFAACAAIELIAFFTAAVGSLRREAAAPVPAWAFGLLPPLGFAVQEFLERWLSGALFPWWMVLQPTFRIGLLLQLPFGLAAYLVARLLLRAADEVGRALAEEPELRRASGPLPGWPVSPTWVPRISMLGARAGRGPPAAAAAISGCAA
ncbi:MAG: hypothetical protein ACXWCU_15605 [Caldimonas sp.]